MRKSIVLYVYHIIELTKVQIKVTVARFQRKTHFIQFRITNQLITEKIRLFTVSLENLIQPPLKPKSPLPLLFFFYFYLFQLDLIGNVPDHDDEPFPAVDIYVGLPQDDCPAVHVIVGQLYVEHGALHIKHLKGFGKCKDTLTKIGCLDRGTALIGHLHLFSHFISPWLLQLVQASIVQDEILAAPEQIGVVFDGVESAQFDGEAPVGLLVAVWEFSSLKHEDSIGQVVEYLGDCVTCFLRPRFHDEERGQNAPQRIGRQEHQNAPNGNVQRCIFLEKVRADVECFCQEEDGGWHENEEVFVAEGCDKDAHLDIDIYYFVPDDIHVSFVLKFYFERLTAAWFSAVESQIITIADKYACEKPEIQYYYRHVLRNGQ